MKFLKRMYLLHMAKKGVISVGVLEGLCELYEYETHTRKLWNGEVAWSLKWGEPNGKTTDREIRRVLSVFFLNHSFVSSKTFAYVLANLKRVLPLFMACLKKRPFALTKAESEVIAGLPQEDFERLRKPLHPWIEKELLTDGNIPKIKWYCQHFEFSSDAEMHFALLASQPGSRLQTNQNLDYPGLLLEYVKAQPAAFNNDCAYDFLRKQNGLPEVMDAVLSRRADK